MSNNTKPFAFVLMPFDASFKDIYEIGIKQTLENAGIIAERVDEQRFSERMLERIYRQIASADFIIADMSGKNPNVFYEVGYAHALGKACTLLTNSADDIPFDLKDHRHLVYDGSIGNLRSQLHEEAQWLLSEFDRQKNGTFEISLTHSDGMLENGEWQTVGSIDFSIHVKNISDRRSPQIDEFQVRVGKDWSMLQDGKECHGYPDPDRSDARIYSLKPSISHLATGASTVVQFEGRKRFWYKYEGKTRKQKEYKSKGNLIISMNTSEGQFLKTVNIECNFDEMPF